MTELARGNGVGLEITGRLVRGVVLGSDEPGRLVAAAEVGIENQHDDRTVLDSLVRLRIELGEPSASTRVGVFPPRSTLERRDVTGLTGAELNRQRSELAVHRALSSTVLVDEGPRRWLIAVHWNETFVRRWEELVERAGFHDVTMEPSPQALARVVPSGTTRIRRNAATDESFEMIMSGRNPVAAAAVDSIGQRPPSLSSGGQPIADTWFDGFDDPADLVAEIRSLVEADIDDERAADLELAGEPYPAYPPHDLRAPERQCVALGAALGAAGLAGRLRPVDMVLPPVSAALDSERPWAVERLSSLPDAPEPETIGPVKRFVARLLPRRR
jgi:hypothetical protein